MEKIEEKVLDDVSGGFQAKKLDPSKKYFFHHKQTGAQTAMPVTFDEFNKMRTEGKLDKAAGKFGTDDKSWQAFALDGSEIHMD